MILNSDQIPTVSSAFTGSGSDSQSPVPGSGNSGGGESHQDEELELTLAFCCQVTPGTPGPFVTAQTLQAPAPRPSLTGQYSDNEMII